MNTTTPVIREAPVLAERLLDLDGIARAFLEHREERLIHSDAGTCRTNGKWRALVGVVAVHHDRREILDTVLLDVDVVSDCPRHCHTQRRLDTLGIGTGFLPDLHTILLDHVATYHICSPTSR